MRLTVSIAREGHSDHPSTCNQQIFRAQIQTELIDSLLHWWYSLINNICIYNVYIQYRHTDSIQIHIIYIYMKHWTKITDTLHPTTLFWSTQCLSSMTFSESMIRDPQVPVASGVSGPSKQAALKGISETCIEDWKQVSDHHKFRLRILVDSETGMLVKSVWSQSQRLDSWTLATWTHVPKRHLCKSSTWLNLKLWDKKIVKYVKLT